MPLFHFTDDRNLPSIKKYGLMCWPLLIAQQIKHYPASSGPSRSLDKNKNLEGYVRLSRGSYHPMAAKAEYEGRVNKIIWLAIDEVVAQWSTTLFSDQNATANSVVINSDPRTAYESDNNQAEILVHRAIPTELISFPNYESVEKYRW
jgi:hypothetical protein